jgi:hypothetical protein
LPTPEEAMSNARVLCLVLFCLLAFGLLGCDEDLSQAALSTPSPTATVLASPSPTSTVRPTTVSLSSPTPVPLPLRLDDFANYAPTIVEYLNDSNGDEDGLRAALESWGALREVTDLLRVDVDDDGVGELLMVITDPSAGYGINAPGDLLVVDRDDGHFSLAYSAAVDSPLLDPVLMEVDDLNGDGHTELAYSSTSCGAHTCFTAVYVVASGSGTYEDLTGGGVEMAYVEPSFRDWDGDGIRELIMYGGTIGSVGAGPQRARTEVYGWDGADYVLMATEYDHSNFLYFRVLDANRALLAGEYDKAVALYREAIDDPALDVWMDESEREELAAFSRYRLSLTYLILGQADRAQAARDELLAQQPDNIYAQVVSVLWDAYLRDANLRTACEEVTAFAASNPEAVEVLQDYGYANPTFTPEDVCPSGKF